MIRSLWTGAQGMVAHQFNVDTIANNLANVNTTGFKKNRAEFEDLLYQTVRTAGTPATEDTIRPTPIQVGHGAKVNSTQKLFSQGSLQQTQNNYDMAVQGEGFFRVLNYDGEYAYTRNGSFKVDANKQLVDSNGYRVVPEVVFPDEFIQESISVSNEGLVSVKIPDYEDPIEVAQLELYRFINPAGLNAEGENLFKQTQASGDVIAGEPGKDGMGLILNGFLEMSNVKPVEEIVNLIVANRAYEFSSKSVQTSDNMLSTAVNLKR